MNTPSGPSDPPPSEQRPIEVALEQKRGGPFPVPAGPPAVQPLPDDASPGLLLDSLLKRPAQLIETVCAGGNQRFWFLFLVVSLLAFAVFGLVVGSFYGGTQYLVSPLKICVGQVLALLICFPSFYIFASLSGISVSLRALAGVFLSMFALTGLLLLGFTPVAWVFSQSTESVNFIGSMYVVFWAIATLFGLRLFNYMTTSQKAAERIHLRVWIVIFLLVSLQMTTALRPIIASSKEMLPTEKKFFVAYWLENLTASLHWDQTP